MAKKETSQKKASKVSGQIKATLEQNNKIKGIALLTSGGDGPGMNASIRAIVRSAIGKGLTVWGVNRGYAGLLEGDIFQMDVSSVSNILQRGGTILKTSRCPEFMKKDARIEAGHILRRKKIDALIVLGGNGSFNGAMNFHQETQIPVIGIPATIDNDIEGSEYSIGFDTAVKTAVDAVDKIRDTAASHARIFIVEVMGRNSPAIALHVGVCTGAEYVVLPSERPQIKDIAENLLKGMARGKTSSIIIVAEGPSQGLSYRIQKELERKYQLTSHVCILGHIQRGGIPTPTDRFISSEMGKVAVDAILLGEKAAAIVYVAGRVTTVPLETCLSKKLEFDKSYIELAQALSI